MDSGVSGVYWGLRSIKGLLLLKGAGWKQDWAGEPAGGNADLNSPQQREPIRVAPFGVNGQPQVPPACSAVG